MREHEPDRADNQHEVNPPYPPVDLVAHPGAAARRRQIDVHFALREILRRARMALPARDDQVVRIDRRARVARAQDLVNAMATGAIGRQRRSILRGQAVVALEESLYPVGGQIVLGIQPLRGMAITAHVGGDFERRSALEPYNFVLGMTIRAGRRITMPGSDGFAVDAFLNIFSGLVVAAAAGFRQVRPVKRRRRRGRREDSMPVVAIAAPGGLLLSAGQGQPMDACAVALGLLLMAFGAARRLRPDVVIRVFEGNIAVATGAGIRLMDRSRQLRLIHKQRNALPGGVGLEQGLVRVTIQAGAILDFSAERGSGKGGQQEPRSQDARQGFSSDAHTSLSSGWHREFALHCLPFASLFLRRQSSSSRSA